MSHPYRKPPVVLEDGFIFYSLGHGAALSSERLPFAEGLRFDSPEYQELSSIFSAKDEAVTTMFGKTYPTGRKEALWGLPRYTFSGRTITESPMTAVVSQFISFISSRFKVNPDDIWVFGNRYDTKKGIGDHSDDETNYVGPGMVATLSISPGLDRTFRIKPKKKSPKVPPRVDAPLAHGTCVFMMGKVNPGKDVDSFQDNYTHGIPELGKRALSSATGSIERISLTARFKA